MEKAVGVLRKISIRRRLVYAFLILCVIPIAFMMGMNLTIESIYYNTNQRNNDETFAYESNIRVNDIFEQLELRFNYLIENNDLLTDLYLFATSPEYETDEVVRRIDNTIASIVSIQEEVSYTGVYLKDDTLFSYEKGMTSITNRLKEGEGWSSYYDGRQRWFYRRKTVEIDYNRHIEATFVMVVDIEHIESLLVNAAGSPRQRLAIIDGEGRRVAGQMYAGERYELSAPIGETGLTVINTFSHERYDLAGHKSMILLLLVVLIIAGTGVFLVNESIRIPLEHVLNRMRRLNNFGQHIIQDELDGERWEDEHFILNNEFSAMLKRLNEVLEETYMTKINETELRTRIKELELVALQQRINPHFLYNILDNIFWIAQMEGYDEIGDMVSALGQFFKTSVSEKGAFVTVKTEIENVQSYVRLQKIMHKNQFTDHWSIDTSIMGYKTVKLVLQPVIENCIVHGFEGLEEGGNIYISGQQVGREIVFEIRDDGIGMSQEVCEGIRKKMNSPLLEMGESIGMRNVNQRIKIYFGEAYGMTIKSEINAGTTVRLCIPIKE